MKIHSRTTYECDICENSVKAKGHVYPQKLGFGIRKAVGHLDDDLKWYYEIAKLDFCKDCWDILVTEVQRKREKR